MEVKDWENNFLKDTYIAIVLMESYSEDSDYTPLYEELFILIRAFSLEEAGKKANEYGVSQETSYFNENKILISWKLKKVIDVNSVLEDTIGNVTELYSRHFKNYDAYSKFEPLSNQDRKQQL